MHIDTTYRRAFNIEPNMCWECYSCVKACPQFAIDCRGYADFAVFKSCDKPHCAAEADTQTTSRHLRIGPKAA
jgi:adenosine phosphosulfate reductase beta subunit